MKLELNEDTRLSTARLGFGLVYDKHFKDGWYYFCTHGTYEVIMSAENDFYRKVFEYEEV